MPDRHRSQGAVLGLVFVLGLTGCPKLRRAPAPEGEASALVAELAAGRYSNAYNRFGRSFRMRYDVKVFGRKVGDYLYHRYGRRPHFGLRRVRTFRPRGRGGVNAYVEFRVVGKVPSRGGGFVVKSGSFTVVLRLDGRTWIPSALVPVGLGLPALKSIDG